MRREMKGRPISFLRLALAPIEDTDDITNDVRAPAAKRPQQLPQQHQQGEEEEEEEQEDTKHASHHYSCCLLAASDAMQLH